MARYRLLSMGYLGISSADGGEWEVQLEERTLLRFLFRQEPKLVTVRGWPNVAWFHYPSQDLLEEPKLERFISKLVLSQNRWP